MTESKRCIKLVLFFKDKKRQHLWSREIKWRDPLIKTICLPSICSTYIYIWAFVQVDEETFFSKKITFQLVDNKKSLELELRIIIIYSTNVYRFSNVKHPCALPVLQIQLSCRGLVENGAFSQVALEQCYSNNLVNFSGKDHTTSRSCVVKLADSEVSW